MKKTVVTISREYGSGGRTIGRRLALALGVPCYDRELIELAAEKSGMSPDFIEEAERKASSSFLYNLSMANYVSNNLAFTYSASPNDQAFFAQAAIIRDAAARGSCVIIGRCADYILRDEPGCLHIFLYAPKEARIARAVERYGLSPKEADEHLRDTDRGRANYYKAYTGMNWGEGRSYDLYINTACSGEDGAIEVIRALVNARDAL